MPIPPWLLYSLLTVPIIIGIVLISITLKRSVREGGPLMELEFLGVKLRLSRSLMLIAFGGILIGSPSYFVFTAKATPSISVVPKPPDSAVEEVNHLDKPNYEALVFLKDIRVVDLRSRRKIPKSMEDKPFSPTTWTRYTLVRKTRQVDDITFQFATTGVGLSPRCLSHPYKLRRAVESDIHGGRILKQNWEIVVNVSEVPVDQEFLIINEVTYWNSFRGEESEWASIKAQSETTEEIGLLVIFPDEKPYKHFTMFSYPHGSDQKQPFRGDLSIFPSKTFRTFYWKIPNPRADYAYELDWTW